MNIDNIFSNLEKWIDSNTDNPSYRYHKAEDKISKDIVNKPITAELGNKHIVQQEEQEIRDFVKVLLGLKERNAVLEIGLGKYGGTHMLWRELFNNVVTLEFNGNRIRDFLSKNKLDERSNIICGDSTKAITSQLIPLYKYNLLFLDGDHTYNSIKQDYLNYCNKVTGIIAFHDILSDYYGVKQFLKDLATGQIDGITHEVHTIEHSSVMGIGYIYSE